ncbi:putative fungal-specific transcription factor [Cladorrhinum sp. PSN259]|nr:putative fungal-specific transcription factor [Cladorrhinum sp. PSN259]
MAEYSTSNESPARSAAAPAQAPGTSSSGEILACYVCKRRKVKCDRQLPVCSLCRKLNIPCEYPAYAGRPGPKPGSQGTKRRRLDPSGTPGHDIPSRSSAPAGPASPFDYTARASVVSPGSCYSSSPAIQDDSITRRDNPTPEGAGLSPSSTRARRLSNHSTTAPIFSRIMYPSHESLTRPQSPSTVDTPSDHQGGGPKITVQSVCESLKINKATYDTLMTSYFNNMTAFSLFKPNSIELKFTMMQYHSDAEALIAAMFSFSARHCRDQENNDIIPTPAYFAKIASSRLDESVDRYDDLPPPFWLIQAGILVTFYQLTNSVRSRSWKKLGDCIRYSYDVNLHMVDANLDPTTSSSSSSSESSSEKIHIQRWSLLEERRRAWWAIWEMDVFASTIRRLPTAIDGSMNLTMLPVPDSCWFNDVYQESCFLVSDCSQRWKHLAKSGNKSARAWFIVINSLMRNTQRIVYPAGPAIQRFVDKAGSNNGAEAPSNHDELSIMANCLYCTLASLPAGLAYQGETLDFRLPKESRQEHSDKYSIHLMTQLCRFMIYHHKICARAPWLRPSLNKSPPPPSNNPHSTKEEYKDGKYQVSSEWSNYMSAADEIVTLVRNSSRDHYRYVNPFLLNTIWFSAAAQCACLVFGPLEFNRRVASSNLDLLKITIDKFVEFWGGMEGLKAKLARIEAGLVSLVACNNEEGDAQGRDKERVGGVLDTGGIQREKAVEDDNMGMGMGMGERRAVASLVQMAGIDNCDDNGVSLEPGPPPPLPPGVLGSNGGMGDYLCDFTQPFFTNGQHFFGADPVDISPFGLEELLMSGMDPQQFRAGGGGFPYRM